MGIDLATDEEFHRHVFDPKVACEVLDCFLEHSLDPCIYVDHQELDVIVSQHPSICPGHLAYLGKSATVGDLQEVVATLPVFAFGLIGRPFEWLEPVASGLLGKASTSLQQTFEFEGAGLTVVPLGLSKWNGVLAYCKQKGISKNSVLAIGDGPNDVDLMRHAAVAISLEGSHPTALAVAHHVVPSVDDGGWADLIPILAM